MHGLSKSPGRRFYESCKNFSRDTRRWGIPKTFWNWIILFFQILGLFLRNTNIPFIFNLGFKTNLPETRPSGIYSGNRRIRKIVKMNLRLLQRLKKILSFCAVCLKNFFSWLKDSRFFQISSIENQVPPLRTSREESFGHPHYDDV